MTVTLRLATLADAAFLLRWRNDPLTRANSLSPEAITPEQHAAWLAATLASGTRYLYVAEASFTEAIGTVRLDRLDRPTPTAEVSITVAPEHRGQGWAGPMLEAVRMEAKAHGITRVVATVKPGNTASLRAFLAAGYRITAPAGVLTLEREGTR